MHIEPPCVVSLTWTLTDAQDRPIDTLDTPVEFLVGGDDLLAPVEDALAGHEAGDDVALQLEPEQAFGDYDAALVCFEDRNLFPETLDVGMAFEGLPEGAKTPDMPADAIYVVTEIYPTHVVLDGNHPLAGIALRLRMRVVEVRAATEAEVEAGTVGSGPFTLVDPASRPPRDLH